MILDDPVEKHFPDGPKQPLAKWVHIVVVTPEGAWWETCFNWLGQQIVL